MQNAAHTPFGDDSFTFLKLEDGTAVRIVQGLQVFPPGLSGTPVNMKWPNTVDLNNRRVWCVAKHSAPLRNEGVTAGLHFLHRRAVKSLAYSEIQCTLHYGYVLIDWVSMRRDDAAGKFSNSDYEWLSNFLRIAVEYFDILRH